MEKKDSFSGELVKDQTHESMVHIQEQQFNFGDADRYSQ